VTPSDVELIRRAVTTDDRAAFGELVIRHQSSVRHFLRHLTHSDTALADDLAQDTFVSAYSQLPRFRGDAAFSTWLLGIAHNHWRNARRRHRPDVSLDEAPEAASAVDDRRSSDLRHDLALAVRQLSADAQLVLHLHYQQGLTHHEIASVLEQPLGTVKTHLARSKETLRHHLAVWNHATR
jgi:RNA polymerase sigma-70 factor (ECF subfamily)